MGNQEDDWAGRERKERAQNRIDVAFGGVVQEIKVSGCVVDFG
jgi:hypothetical protein